MRVVVLALLFALGASGAVAADWGKVATVSGTMGVKTNRLCVGEASRGDIGCPTYAPSLTTAGDVSISGNVSANKFIGDGSGLTNVGAASTDRITSGTTSMLAISSTGFVSLTQSGVNTGWFDPTRGLVTIGVSSTGPISGTTGYYSGYVGIFGATPNSTYPLDVAGNARVQATLYVGTTLRMSDGYGVNWPGNNDTLKGDSTTHYLALTTSGTEAMRIVSSGFVGIGITSPGARLEVAGTASATTMQSNIFNATLANTTTYYTSNQINSYSANGYGISTNPLAGSNATLTLGTGPAAPVIFQTSGTEAMRIISSGYVGIGTTSPGARLEAAGNIRATGFELSTSYNSINVPAVNALGLTTSGTERMRITSTGLVGIGTTTPNAKLDVYGTISATNLVIGGVSITGAGAATDTITSGTSKVVVNGNGYVSFTTSGTTTGYMNTAGVFVLPGISTTGAVSATSLFTSGLTTTAGVLSTGAVAITNNFASFSDGYGLSWGGVSSISGYSANSGYLAFRTSTTEAMRIVSTGYVGIGTTAPSGSLHVAGSVPQWGSNNFGAQIIIGNAGTSRNPALVLLDYTNSNTTLLTNNSGNISILGLPDWSAGSAASYMATFLRTGDFYPQRHLFVPNGSLGVGTLATTSASLQVVGGGAIIANNTAIGFGTLTSRTATTALEVSGTISATNFVGNASGLTNVPAATVTSGTNGSLIYRDASGNLTASTTFIVSDSRMSLSAGGTLNGNPYSLYVQGPIQNAGNINAGNNVTGSNMGISNGGYFGWGNTNTKLTGDGTSSNYIAFTTSGTEAMRIVSTGYVGIGTASPSSTLQVAGSVTIVGPSGGQALSIYSSSGGGSTASIASNGSFASTGYGFKNDGTTSINTASYNNLSFYVNSLETMRLKPNLVGINTITPTTSLEVSGTISATNFVGNASGLTNVPAATVTSGTTGSLIYRDATGNLTANSNILASGNNVYASNFAPTNGAGIVWGTSTKIVGDGSSATNQYIAFTASSTEAMRIVSTGYVGIGTATPTAALTVGNGGIQAQQAIYAGSGYGLGWNSAAFTSNMNNNNVIAFFTSTIERARFSSGKFGIGTTTPSTVLHVSGTALTTSWTGINFSDYTNVTPTAPLEVSGTISATGLVIGGVSITGAGAATDTITSGTSKVVVNGNGYVSFTTSGTTTGYMDTAGKFVLPGISTTGPISGTSIYAGVQGVSGSIIFRDANGVLSAANGFYYNPANFSLYTSAGVTGGSSVGVTNGPVLAVSNSVPLIRTTNTGQDLAFGANGFGGTEAMRIVSTGYVGIGTTAPGYNIDVSGTGRVTGGLISGYLSTGYLNLNSGDGIRWNGNADYIFGYTGAAQHYLTFNTSGTEAMRIVSSGYVGIGTSTPGYPLDVSMSSANLVRFGNSSQNITLGAFTVANSSGNLALRSANDLNLQSGGSATNRMVIQAGGNVGIGTSNPNAALEVSGTISATGLVIGGVSITGAGAATDNIVSGTDKVTVNGTTHTISFTTNGSVAGYIDASGNHIVPGISTTGTVSTVTLLASGNAVVNGSVYSANSIFLNSSSPRSLVWNGSSSALIQGDPTNKYIMLSTSGTEAMRIVSSGYVGIGTQSPTNPLYVNGSATVSGNLAVNGNVNAANYGVSASTIQLYQAGAYNGTQITTYSTNLYSLGGANAGGAGYGITLRSGDASGNSAANQNIGNLTFQSDYGWNFKNAARIAALVDGTASTTSMPGRLAFFTSPQGSTTLTERMRIDSYGAVGIGITPTLAATGLEVNGTISATSAVIGGIGTGNINASGYVNAATLKISGMGSSAGTNPVCVDTSTGTFSYAASCTASDIRLKQDIKPLAGNLDKIMLMKPVTYHWKDASRGTAEEIGLIAQDVAKVYPQLAFTGSDGLMGVDYAKLVPPLIGAVQEQQREIESLQAGNTGLKAANDNARRDIEQLKAANDNLRKQLDDLRDDVRALKAQRQGAAR